ncbi:MAG: hypothetical protein ACI9MR_003530 [Myxococcota bacterium]|jgi:hypothetical protein
MSTSALILTAGVGAGCADEEADDGACLSTADYFSQEVWAPILSQDCIGCHNPQGEARLSDFVLKSPSQPGFMDANLATVRHIAGFEFNGTSVLLLRPVLAIDHPGGMRFSKKSSEYKALKELVERFKSPEECADSTQENVFAGVSFTGTLETLRKASLNLVGRLPTIEEEQRIVMDGEAVLDEVLLDMMAEPAFETRVKEIYNDKLLTDRYLRGDDAANLLNSTDYPDRRWWDDDAYSVDDETRTLGDRHANDAIARDALELIANVVRNDRPFTEILTADYTMVNPFSARAFGVEGRATFVDDTDPTEFVEVQIPDVPHAGVLTSPMFLNRFPTTATNRNRHRARMVYNFFLATDVLKLAERPIDPTQVVDHNPTMFNANCSVCHAVIDPLAGTFQNWTDRGAYRPMEDGWFGDMRPPGFGEAEVPSSAYGSSVQWAAKELVEDPRFARGAVQIMFEGVTGQSPLGAPEDTTAADYPARQRAFETQDAVFSKIAGEFAATDYNLKHAVLGIVRSEYFRAENLLPDVELSPERSLEIAAVGMGRLLPPEQLNRKIEAVTGFPWRRRVTDTDYLLGDYRIFYGGIDSNQVTKRIVAPNGIMANVGWRMANDVSCRVVAQDFTLNRVGRKLFPHVEMTYAPEDENGFVVAGARDAIRKNIQYLHERVVGETLELKDPEISRTYELFLETWREGIAGVRADEVDDDLLSDCRARNDFFTGEELHPEKIVQKDPMYTARAWMAVMTYLLSDYRFLYE